MNIISKWGKVGAVFTVALTLLSVLFNGVRSQEYFPIVPQSECQWEPIKYLGREGDVINYTPPPGTEAMVESNDKGNYTWTVTTTVVSGVTNKPLDTYGRPIPAGKSTGRTPHTTLYRDSMLPITETVVLLGYFQEGTTVRVQFIDGNKNGYLSLTNGQTITATDHATRVVNLEYRIPIGHGDTTLSLHHRDTAAYTICSFRSEEGEVTPTPTVQSSSTPTPPSDTPPPPATTTATPQTVTPTATASTSPTPTATASTSPTPPVIQPPTATPTSKPTAVASPVCEMTMSKLLPSAGGEISIENLGGNKYKFTYNNNIQHQFIGWKITVDGAESAYDENPLEMLMPANACQVSIQALAQTPDNLPEGEEPTYWVFLPIGNH